MLGDADMKELCARTRLPEIQREASFPSWRKTSSSCLSWRPDEKHIIVGEFRAAEGGDEAANIAGSPVQDVRSCADQGLEDRDARTRRCPRPADNKAIIQFKVKGDPRLLLHDEFESGVHGVQRVPKTQSQGRIHTSTATWCVPEADGVGGLRYDLRIDVFRAGGRGGQCVNTTDWPCASHAPSHWACVQSQDQKSQLQNNRAAMSVLRARLYEKMLAEQQAEEGRQEAGADRLG